MAVQKYIRPHGSLWNIGRECICLIPRPILWTFGISQSGTSSPRHDTLLWIEAMEWTRMHYSAVICSMSWIRPRQLFPTVLGGWRKNVGGEWRCITCHWLSRCSTQCHPTTTGLHYRSPLVILGLTQPAHPMFWCFRVPWNSPAVRAERDARLGTVINLVTFPPEVSNTGACHHQHDHPVGPVWKY